MTSEERFERIENLLLQTAEVTAKAADVAYQNNQAIAKLAELAAGNEKRMAALLELIRSLYGHPPNGKSE